MIDTVEAAIKLLEDNIDYSERPRELRAALILLRRVRDADIKNIVNGALEEVDSQPKDGKPLAWLFEDETKGHGFSFGFE